jgi:plastocyanin
MQTKKTPNALDKLKSIAKLAGFLGILFLIYNVASGSNLTRRPAGNTNSFATAQASVPSPTIENGVQIVRMTETANGYAPNQFTVKKGVPVRWIVDAQDPNSCASSIVMQKMNISRQLTKGENIIEFMPNETGVLKFSCSMGMYTGFFNVVDDQGNGASAAELNTASQPASGTCGMMSGGGSCGCGGGAGIKSSN